MEIEHMRTCLGGMIRPQLYYTRLDLNLRDKKLRIFQTTLVEGECFYLECIKKHRSMHSYTFK